MNNISKVLTEYYIDCMIVSVFWLYAVNAINMLFLCTITQFRSSYYIHTMHYKKKDKDNRGNYRALGLLNHGYKVFAMILLARISPYIMPKLLDT